MTATRIVVATLASAWLSTAFAGAEFIGLNLGNTSAQSSPSIESSGFDLVDDLDVDNPEQSSMVLILEHPIAALPNIRYQGYSLDSSDHTTLNPKFSFNGAVDNTAGPFKAGAIVSLHWPRSPSCTV